MSKCPVTTVLNHLKRFAGLPVPYVVPEENGKPDFRKTDPKMWLECVLDRKCPVCGKALGDWAFYVGGPACRNSEVFNDSGMHEMCAREAMRLCPFLSGVRGGYRGDDLNAAPHQDATARPVTMYLMKGWSRSAKLIQVGKHVAVGSGPLKVMEEF